MTLDGICDHTTCIPGEDLHQHYSDVLNNAGLVLYGQTTYELMQFWKTKLENPSGKNQWMTLQFQLTKFKNSSFQAQ